MRRFYFWCNGSKYTFVFAAKIDTLSVIKITKELSYSNLVLSPVCQNEKQTKLHKTRQLYASNWLNIANFTWHFFMSGSGLAKQAYQYMQRNLGLLGLIVWRFAFSTELRPFASQPGGQSQGQTHGFSVNANNINKQIPECEKNIC